MINGVLGGKGDIGFGGVGRINLTKLKFRRKGIVKTKRVEIANMQLSTTGSRGRKGGVPVLGVNIYSIGRMGKSFLQVLYICL